MTTPSTLSPLEIIAILRHLGSGRALPPVMMVARELR